MTERCWLSSIRFFFSSRRRHTRWPRDWSSDVCFPICQMFLAQLGADDFPGTSVVGIRPDGKIWRYNLETGHGDVLATDIEGAPATTMSLAPGGDGQVYVGAYLSSGVMARIDPQTGEIEQLNGPEQADAITAHGPDTFIGKIGRAH